MKVATRNDHTGMAFRNNLIPLAAVIADFLSRFFLLYDMTQASRMLSSCPHNCCEYQGPS